MDASGLHSLGGWLGRNAREMDFNGLDAGALSAVALALPQHVVEELSLRSNLASVVAGGLLGPPDVARGVFSRCAECGIEGVCRSGRAAGAGREVMEAKVVEQEEEEKEFLKKPNSSKGAGVEKQQWASSKEAKDGQMTLALALVAAVSRAGHAYLPDSPVVQLVAAVEMLVVLICLLSSARRREGRVGSHIISIVVKAVLMIALYAVELVIPFADEFELGQGIKFSNDRSLLEMGGCVLALVIVFMSSAESHMSRWLSQVAALSSFLIGAYLPCLLHEARLEEVCKLPTTNFLVVTLCVTFSSMLSSAARFQGNRSTIFKWRTKDGDLVSKLG